MNYRINGLLGLLILVIVLLTGCASHATVPSGAYRALNPGRWQPTSDDLRGGQAQLSPILHAPDAKP